MTGRMGALMVCGAMSGAGKSTVAAGLCRSWARRGLKVAPFKAQNMSNHAAVTVDGGEVGRAQAMQAHAARCPLDRRMNPILLKPTSENRSHLVVLGAHGTIDLLPEAPRSPVAGIIFNRFRGDASLLDDGIAELEQRCGVPVLGVLPHLGDQPMLGVEDSLDIGHGVASEARSPEPVRVAAIRLPHLANPSDLDPFLVEPDVELRWVTRPSELATADLIVLPGSRSTVADLSWLRRCGFAEVLQHSEAWIVGICAGYQMLGHLIHDQVESSAGTVKALELLDVDTTFESAKTVRRSRGSTIAGQIDGGEMARYEMASYDVAGYEIRHGLPSSREQPWFCLDGEDEGALSPDGRIYGTSLHGLFDADGFRAHLLSTVAEAKDRDYSNAPTSFGASLDAHHDLLADWIESHLDTSRLIDVAATASPPGECRGW